MTVDVPEPSTSPRRRTSFRTRSPAPPLSDAHSASGADAWSGVSGTAAPDAGLRFTRLSEAPGNDADILIGYQLFLGRDPENSFVIREAKAGPVRSFIRGLVGSGEFEAAVATPLGQGQRMPHERSAPGPSPQQITWLCARLEIEREVRETVEKADSWAGFWRALAGLPGLFPGRMVAEQAPVAAQIAEGGFVLITIDQPKAGERLFPGALVSGSGWAIAPAEIVDMTVHLDERLLTHARHGLPRPDVARNFPHYRHVDHCGFAFSAQVPQDAQVHARSQLRVSLRTEAGHVGERGVAIEPPETAAAPSDAWPIRLFVEDAAIDAGGVLNVRGWVVSRVELAGVSVFVGEAGLGQARTGLERPDIAALHPDYANAGRAGFLFAVSLAGQPAGDSVVRVQARDAAGRQRQAIIPVTVPLLRGQPPNRQLLPATTATPALAVLADIEAAAERSLGTGTRGPANTSLDTMSFGLAAAAALRLEIDHPASSGSGVAAVTRGALTISGWVVAPEGVEQVSVLCDGVALGRAYLGMRREDIGRAFPHCTDSLRAGFALVIPPGAVSEGERHIQVVARSRNGGENTRSFTVRVEPPDARRPGCTIRRSMPRAETAFGLRVLAAIGCRPAFTIAVRSPDPSPFGLALLMTTLSSLDSQTYDGWNARITVPDLAAVQAAHDTASSLGKVADRLTFTVADDRAERPAEPGSLAPTDTPHTRLLGALDAGDEFGCDALLEMALACAMHPGAGFFYCDELRWDPAHRRLEPFCKPDWSPELLLATNYIGQFWCATEAACQAAGLVSAALRDGGGYDTVLRLTETASAVHHVPKLLVRRGALSAEPPLDERAALGAAMQRRGMPGHPSETPAPGVWRVPRALDLARNARSSGGSPLHARDPADARVSIVMPTCGGRDLVRQAIASVRATTTALDVELVVLDNVAAGNRKLKTWLKREADILVDMPGPFNWSRFNNVGAAAATGAYLLFLNDDIEAAGDGWLEALLEHAQRAEVGVVGARLLYPDGKVQHAGQYLAETHARHAFRFADGSDHGPFGLARASREMAAVTGACMLVRRETFDALGRFDEAHSVVNNDLDFCLRVRQAGLSVIYTPHAELMHHELASRAQLEDTYDAARFFGKWRHTLLKGDPFHTPRLLADADHYVAEPELVQPVHVGPPGLDAATVRTILAVKLDHIGDYLTALPALAALRRNFPDARLVLLAPPATAALARHEATIDEVVEFTFFHARSAHGQRTVSKAEFEALRAQLAPYRFDLAIDLRMQPETRPVLQRSGARLLAGYDSDARYPWLDVALEWEGDQRLVPKHAHISERLLQLVAAVADACRPMAAIPSAAAVAPENVPVLARLPADFLAKRLVCVHPGVGNVVRQWPAASYAALIDLLVVEEDVHAILIGGGDEQAIATEVMAAVQSRAAVVSLVGAIKLAELPQLMRACALFVGNNSGPKHLAASLGVPTLGIHSGVVDAAEWGPLGPAAFAVKREVICGPCYLEFAGDCPRALACLTGIKPRDVLAACQPLLALSTQARKSGGQRPPEPLH